MATGQSTTRAGRLETRGIEPAPEAECHGNPLQLFWV